ncbi:MAG TPA: LON peptidase substrate-binding domain-containing protein [Verrucomicrobiae bacterium]|nr:LON peptidase substrate-binding domain-containing protein [Verrucomicrobiae bacterium]
MPKPTRIPLFPLDTVLLPGMRMPLHIFEPRYKTMIGRCLREEIEFGLILAASKAIATLGCTAEIVDKTKDYPDGRMDILTEGRAIFRLNELIDEKEYYEGDVEYIDDEPSTLDAQTERQLTDTFEQCHALLFGRPWVDADRKQSGPLSYHMAGILPMELAKRQALLETRSESDRRGIVLHWMAEFLPKLEAVQRARRIAGGNGHGPN